jgi:cysteine desulfuration protein SufE
MGLPPALQRIVDDFASAPTDLRIEMLFEFTEKVSAPPPDAEGAGEAMERVVECQTPFFLSTAVRPDGTVDMSFDCPVEAPTTRGFAGILSEGLQGSNRDEILAVPDDFYLRMGLGDAISPLRLRGMSAILRRLKRQLRERPAA